MKPDRRYANSFFQQDNSTLSLDRVHGSGHEVLQNRTGFSKADANGPKQWKATGLKRNICT
jgi:hypothetical protein